MILKNSLLKKVLARITMRLLCINFLILMTHAISVAQDSINIKFGDLSIADFNKPIPKLMTNSSAIVIADIGKTDFVGPSISTMKQVYTRFIRVKILNKNGFHIADYRFLFGKPYKISIDSLFSLQASTFNLENGAIRETKLDPSSIYDEAFGKYAVLRKFTMPALKEGSFFDILVSIKIPIRIPIRSWDFQSNYPCLWSEYNVVIPPFFQYKIKYQGDSLFDVATNKVLPFVFGEMSYSHGNAWMSGNGTHIKWVKKNVPALENEVYSSSIKNYADRVSFDLEYFELENKRTKNDYEKSWQDLSYNYFKEGQFGDFLLTNTSWLKNEMDKRIPKGSSKDEIIQDAYYFIRNNFNCTYHFGIYPGQSLWKVFKDKSGTVSELNLLLYGILREYDILVYPAILSTKENGLPHFDHPLLEEYNYIVCVVKNGNDRILLDASWPENPYGKLLPNCYNGGAQILDETTSEFIKLNPDSLVEKKLTNVFIANDEKEGITGTYSVVYGAGESYDIREKIRKSSKDEYFKHNPIEFGDGVNIQEDKIDSLDYRELPLQRQIELGLKDLFNKDIIYFQPIVSPSFKTNPFFSTLRHCPVEMPYKLDEVYLFFMDIPKGFQVDEIPKSTRLTLNQNQGTFDYIIQQNPENIQIQVQLKLNKTIFNLDEYSSLREFYDEIIKKEKEQIVFKKSGLK
jgi:hypothetical protein